MNNRSHGTPQQLEQLVRQRIAELDPTMIESSTDVDTIDVNSQLWDTVEAELNDRGVECELHPNNDSLTVYIGSSEYTVPYDDLSLDAEHIDDDVEYIVGTICEMEDKYNGEE